MWVVRDVAVWGTTEDAEMHYLTVESVESANRLMYSRAAIGGAAQDILFEELIDHNGNPLPESIESPRVLIRPRSPYQAFLTGEESKTGFRIARDSAAPGPVSVDFFIYETGHTMKVS